MRWSEDQTCHFVKLYVENELLWQPEHPFYRSKLRRNRIIANICAEFEIKTGLRLGTNDCLNKIKNLRSTYAQEIKKILRRSNADNPYIPELKWFSIMHKHLKELPSSRLKDVPIASNTTQNYIVDEEVEDKCENWLEVNPLNDDDNPLSSDQDYTNLKQDIEDEDVTLWQCRAESPKCKNKRRKIKLNSPNQTLEPESTMRNSELVEASTSKEDEFDIYGKYIASQLRKMDLQKALRLQLQIQTLVSEARISEISSLHLL